MSLDFIAFLLGLFGIPLALLAMGHRFRRRSRRVRAMFWGARAGHIVAAVLAVGWGMIPPEAWEPTETARGFAGLWSLLIFPVAGAALFGLKPERHSALAIFALPIACLQQPSPTLAPVIGSWQRVDDGGPALKVDGAAWSGKTSRSELEAAAKPVFGSVSDALVANTTGDGAFPLAVWTGAPNFTGGVVRVRLKLISGSDDRSGGVVFGLTPAGEYYYVRYNTKDGNVALWRYEKGTRKVIKHGEHHQQLPLNQWHELVVRVSGRSVVGNVTGTDLTVEHRLDAPVSGRVGLWAKRDVVTIFRDFRVAH
jgi:hypothetical protein